MTRESEKSKIRMSVIVDGKHINSLKKADEVIDQIFDEFGEKLQDKDDEIELLKCRIEEAMKPKTCDGCSNLEDIGKSYKHCKELCINISHSTESTFYCNRYEAKG
jgi:hypothetical protein